MAKDVLKEEWVLGEVSNDFTQFITVDGKFGGITISDSDYDQMHARREFIMNCRRIIPGPNREQEAIVSSAHALLEELIGSEIVCERLDSTYIERIRNMLADMESNFKIGE